MILVTGGMGFIGLHTARRFLDTGEEVVITQHHSRREPEFLADQVGKRLHIEQCDVTDRDQLEAVLKKHGVTDIAHLVAPALNSLPPDEDFDTGVRGLLNILQAAKGTGVRRVTLASSGGVYGGLSSGPFREDALLPMESRSATETFKKTWEILGYHYGQRTGLDVVSMRIGAIWGPLFWHGGIFPVVRLCHAAARGSGLGEGPELFEDDESPPCYVTDCVRGIQMLQKAEKLAHSTYNVSVGYALTNRQITEAIRKVKPGFSPDLKPGTSPRNRKDAYFDTSRIKEDVGFEPEYSIERAVAEYIGWLEAHLEETMTK